MNEDPKPLGPPRQLWLFTPPRPLVERFGTAFFRSIPRQPGIYFFHDESERLLYIGKAKDLRNRLGSYRYVRPDRGGRKTWRLVNCVHRIAWEECATHADALLAESRLLRQHRPPFNRANVWPWSAVYVGLRTEAGTLHLRVSRNLDQDYEWFGAFKAFAIYAFSALRRTLLHVAVPQAAPPGWFREDTGRAFSIPAATLDIDQLRRFLQGTSRAFLQDMEARRAMDCSLLSAQQNLVLNDLVLLEEFFEMGPKRNRLLREETTASGLVSPETLADWLATRSA